MQDFKSWESCLESANRDDYQPYAVGIVAVPDERGLWACPELFAWVCRYENGG